MQTPHLRSESTATLCHLNAILLSGTAYAKTEWQQDCGAAVKFLLNQLDKPSKTTLKNTPNLDHIHFHFG